MTTAYERAHGRERLRTLIEFAIREGWQVRRTDDGRILFSKPGSAVFYTGATASHTVTLCNEGDCHG